MRAHLETCVSRHGVSHLQKLCFQFVFIFRAKAIISCHPEYNLGHVALNE